jgi:hypothetical protein
MIPTRGTNNHRTSSFKIRPVPPISCICTPHYYADESLLNPP